MGGEKKRKCGRVCSTHTLRQAHKLSGLLPGGKKQTLVPRSSALPRRHFLQAVRMKDRKSGRNPVRIPIRSPNAKNTFIKQSAIWREIPLEWDERKLDGVNKRKQFQEKGKLQRSRGRKK